MFQKQRLKNSKKGFSLPMAMAISVFLVIIATALIFISMQSMSTTSVDVSGRQAYLNVRSAIEYARAYYSNNHKGFCIEYTVEDPELIYPVSYEQKRVPIASIIAGMFSEFEQAYNNHEPLSLDALFYACVMRYQFLMKHVSWKHEEEYRIIYPFVTNIGNNMLINKIGLRTSRIVAGINCSDEHKKRLNAISQKINCGSIKEAQISDTEYILIK